MSKFYRVKKDTFMWDAGAILERGGGGGGYVAISDIWNACDELGAEYISGPIIENSPDWFERVYPVNGLTKMVYKLKAEAKALMEKEYKE